MPTTAQEIVTRAYYLSGIVGRDYETVSGSQLLDGLDLLNDVLSEIGIQGLYQPYYSHTTLSFAEGEDNVFVPNLIETQAVTYTINPPQNSVVYTMVQKTVKEFFDKSYVKNIKSLPYEYYVEREAGGSRIYTYFVPQTDYVFEITGKYAVTDAIASTDLSTTFDRVYLSYLKYAVADRICHFNQQMLDPDTRQELGRLRTLINSMVSNDYSNDYGSILGQDPYTNSLDGRYSGLYKGYIPV